MSRLQANALLFWAVLSMPVALAQAPSVVTSSGQIDPLLAAGVPLAPSDQSSTNEMYQSLGSFGLAAGNLFVTAARSGHADPSWDAGKDAGKVDSDLQTIQANYQRSRDMGRAGTKLLDADLNVVLTGTDIVTEGASLLVTAPTRWVIHQGIGMLTDSSDLSARQALASDLKKFMDDNGRSPQNSSALTEDETNQLNKIPSLQAMKAQFANDPVGSAIVDDAVSTILYKSSKDEIDKLAEQGAQIDDLQDQLTESSKKVTDALSHYETDTNTKLDGLQDEMNGVAKTAASSQSAIEELQAQTANNAAQFNAVEGLTYSHASAADKVAMLKAGYKSDTLTQDEMDNLTNSLEAQAERDELEQDAKTAVGVTQNLEKIATGLGLPPVVGEVLQDASAAEGIAGDVIDGNYLGAVAGLVGLFGSHGPSETAKLQEHIDKQFDKVDKELKQVMDGEEALGKGIEALSSQIDTFQKDTENHLYEIDGRLQDVQKIVVGIQAQGADGCETIERYVDQAGNFEPGHSSDLQDRSLPDMRDPKNLSLVKQVLNYKEPLNNCQLFLTTFGSAPTTLRKGLGPFAYNPLEYWVFADSDPTIGVSGGAANPGVTEYSSAAKLYHDVIYQPATDVYIRSIQAPLKEFGMGSGLTPSQALQLASIPVRDLPNLRKKLNSVGPKDAACVSETYLSAPLSIMLCDRKPWNLGGKSDQLETNADDFATKLLQDPLYLDALPNISHWALFFYPIFDSWSNDQQIILDDPNQVLAGHDLQPLGDQIVNPALDLDTLGIAQANIVYGDVIAASVFNDIWDDNEGLSAIAPAAPKDPNSLTQPEAAQALFIQKELAHGNPYLRSNVLMLAMDSARRTVPAGFDHGYDFALDFVQSSDTNPGFVLTELFNHKLSFDVRWAPKDSTQHPNDYCDKPDTDKKTECIKIPVATILGETVDLPSVEAFSDRDLVYPQSLMDLIAMRDRLAEAAATYNAFDLAVKDLPVEHRTERKIELAKSLTEAVQ